MKAISILISAFFITCAMFDTQGEDMIRNGDFELDTDGNGMADDWQFSGDSGVTAIWSRDEGFTGKFSQKLVCANFVNLSPASHAMLERLT